MGMLTFEPVKLFTRKYRVKVCQVGSEEITLITPSTFVVEVPLDDAYDYEIQIKDVNKEPRTITVSGSVNLTMTEELNT